MSATIYTVLIVEDRGEIRDLWKRFLAPMRPRILEAATLAEAKELMLHIPPPDIVLLDLNLPDSRDRNTLQAIEDFRAANPNCYVVVLTGLPDETLRELSFELGADGFAHKTDMGTQVDLWRAMKAAIEVPNHKRDAHPYERNLSLLEKLSNMICSAC